MDCLTEDVLNSNILPGCGSDVVWSVTSSDKPPDHRDNNNIPIRISSECGPCPGFRSVSGHPCLHLSALPAQSDKVAGSFIGHRCLYSADTSIDPAHRPLTASCADPTHRSSDPCLDPANTSWTDPHQDSTRRSLTNPYLDSVKRLTTDQDPDSPHGSSTDPCLNSDCRSLTGPCPDSNYRSSRDTCVVQSSKCEICSRDSSHCDKCDLLGDRHGVSSSSGQPFPWSTIRCHDKLLCDHDIGETDQAGDFWPYPGRASITTDGSDGRDSVNLNSRQNPGPHIHYPPTLCASLHTTTTSGVGHDVSQNRQFSRGMWRGHLLETLRTREVLTCQGLEPAVRLLYVNRNDRCLQEGRPDYLKQDATRYLIIEHNMRHNRNTTRGLAITPHRTVRGPTLDLRWADAGPRATRTGYIPSLAPASLSILPREVIDQLHNLDPDNEDLSTEVVFSLHFRDYSIKEVLGKGISSTVRRVVQKSTGVEYAVKIIDISGEKGELQHLDQVKKDTTREIAILRMCAGHPNIIELHDVFETSTFIFLVFEICKKGELFDYLTSVVSLSEKRTRIFMRQLIESVAFFHSQNIVHRDLKPENILLDDNLNIKVSDFGFATLVLPGEELTELCGTPGYLAPEVLAHSMYDNVAGYGKEVDMWACGVIMYTLLCGAPPFWNRRQMMMLRAIMAADYTFNSPEWEDITETPKNLIRKLLVLNPKDRLTAKQALDHPFFKHQIPEVKRFHARRKFKASVKSVIFYLRLIFYYKHPPPVSLDMVRTNPYGIKIMRKVIDNCAFGMYKHWVKRVDNQNRAALFENALRDDWKHSMMVVDSIYM